MHKRQPLLQNIERIKPNIISVNENSLTQLLLYCDRNMFENTNTFIWYSVTDYYPQNDLLIPTPYVTGNTVM